VGGCLKSASPRNRYSPERIDPGRTDYILRSTPKVVGRLKAGRSRGGLNGYYPSGRIGTIRRATDILFPGLEDQSGVVFHTGPRLYNLDEKIAAPIFALRG